MSLGKWFLVASAAILSAMSLSASAACPVGKKVGDTWCEKGLEWKCERCGSEYCPIITGRKCVKDDELSQGSQESRLMNLITGAQERVVSDPFAPFAASAKSPVAAAGGR
ncbi:MAG TPA: hypothetical protein VEZ90_10165 [Blastocatellia bacterium]|nr:hypothetical protein [Blastocatellia bacterium]